MTQAEIRDAVDCPTCMARAGYRCTFRNAHPGSRKHRSGANHAKRILAAQYGTPQRVEALIDEGDSW